MTEWHRSLCIEIIQQAHARPEDLKHARDTVHYEHQYPVRAHIAMLLTIDKHCRKGCSRSDGVASIIPIFDNSGTESYIFPTAKCVQLSKIAYEIIPYQKEIDSKGVS